MNDWACRLEEELTDVTFFIDLVPHGAGSPEGPPIFYLVLTWEVPAWPWVQCLSIMLAL